MSVAEDNRRKLFRQILGLDPAMDALSDSTSPLEKMKIYAKEGFIYRFGGDAQDFERLWDEAFEHEKTENKGNKK